MLKVNAYLDSRGQTTKNQVNNLGVIPETDLSISHQSSGPLHWLPVTFRIDFKVLLLIYKSLNGSVSPAIIF